MFDAKQYLEALEPPMFRDPNGVVHRGRVLSVEEWMPFAVSMRDAKALTDPRDIARLVRRLVRAFFPHPWYRRGRSVESWVLSLPPVGQVKAIWSFTESQGKALGMTLTPPPGLQKIVDLEAVSLSADAPPTATP